MYFYFFFNILDFIIYDYRIKMYIIMDYFYLIVNFLFIFRFSELKVMCKLKKRINYYWGFNWLFG